MQKDSFENKTYEDQTSSTLRHVPIKRNFRHAHCLVWTFEEFFTFREKAAVFQYMQNKAIVNLDMKGGWKVIQSNKLN